MFMLSRLRFSVYFSSFSCALHSVNYHYYFMSLVCSFHFRHRFFGTNIYSTDRTWNLFRAVCHLIIVSNRIECVVCIVNNPKKNMQTNSFQRVFCFWRSIIFSSAVSRRFTLFSWWRAKVLGKFAPVKKQLNTNASRWLFYFRGVFFRVDVRALARVYVCLHNAYCEFLCTLT